MAKAARGMTSAIPNSPVKNAARGGFAVMRSKNIWTAVLCTACITTVGQMLPDLILSHAITTADATTIREKQAIW